MVAAKAIEARGGPGRLGKGEVNVLDVVLVLVAISAAMAGYRLGFVARATSWAGLALGVTVGALVLPSLLRHLQGSSDVTVALVAIVILVELRKHYRRVVAHVIESHSPLPQRARPRQVDVHRLRG